MARQYLLLHLEQTILLVLLLLQQALLKALQALALCLSPYLAQITLLQHLVQRSLKAMALVGSLAQLLVLTTLLAHQL